MSDPSQKPEIVMLFLEHPDALGLIQELDWAVGKTRWNAKRKPYPHLKVIDLDHWGNTPTEACVAALMVFAGEQAQKKAEHGIGCRCRHCE